MTITGNNPEMKNMKLVISKVGSNASQAPRRRAESTKREYVVYPLSLEPEGSYTGGIITGVGQVTGCREIVSVEYYNVAGMRSERPWQGVNIVVTRYNDGTTSTNKVIR